MKERSKELFHDNTMVLAPSRFAGQVIDFSGIRGWVMTLLCAFAPLCPSPRARTRRRTTRVGAARAGGGAAEKPLKKHKNTKTRRNMSRLTHPAEPSRKRAARPILNIKKSFASFLQKRRIFFLERKKQGTFFPEASGARARICLGRGQPSARSHRCGQKIPIPWRLGGSIFLAAPGIRATGSPASAPAPMPGPSRGPGIRRRRETRAPPRAARPARGNRRTCFRRGSGSRADAGTTPR